jgi:hypothetical protein
MIQEQAHGLPSWQRTGQQKQRDLPMIKLDAIACHTVDGALQTAGTMTQVTGVAFVTVQNDYAQAVNIRQGFVSFQVFVNVVNPLSQPVGVEQSMDASQTVCAEGRFPEPTLPEAGPADLFPSVAAAQPGPKQHQRRFHHRCGGNAWFLSSVGNQCDNVFGELKDLFRIGDQAAKDYRFFS